MFQSSRPRFLTLTALLVVLTLANVVLIESCAHEAKKPATGPLRVKLQLVKEDGTEASTANLHLVTITRDAKGELSGLAEHYGKVKIAPESTSVGAICMEIPREMVKKGQEFSLALNPPDYGFPSPIRRGGALLSFSVDETTEEIDLGKVVVK